MIPLGLYRKSSHHRLYYVATNPEPNTLLDADDMVYVLHQQEGICELHEGTGQCMDTAEETKYNYQG